MVCGISLRHVMKSLFAPLLSVCLLAHAAGSAEIHKEPFAAGANGWEGSVQLGAGAWTFTGDVARLTFSDTTPAPIPDIGILSNLPWASSGSFTGNYDQIGIELIGFRFMAPTDLPSGITLRWGGSTSVYHRQFIVTQTGTWQTLAASLANAEAGGWSVVEGSLSDFQEARKKVQFVSIRIQRSGTTERSYLIDDLFIDRRAAAGTLQFTGDATAQLSWGDLVSNLTYRVEAATELTGTWTTVQHVLATNRTVALNLTHQAPRLFWRLAIP